jgi:hypothetical protein
MQQTGGATAGHVCCCVVADHSSTIQHSTARLGLCIYSSLKAFPNSSSQPTVHTLLVFQQPAIGYLWFLQPQRISGAGVEKMIAHCPGPTTLQTRAVVTEIYDFVWLISQNRQFP